MGIIIGIRREDKNRWERRVPLIPADLALLQEQHGLQFLVQPSSIRTYTDQEFTAAGIQLSEDLAAARLIFAVKEIPTELLRPGCVYATFSHVVKGQTYNMPMLKRLLELGCTLVDYERIADSQNRRLIFFSLHAGYAGMIETLWCLGRRLQALGKLTPFATIRHAHEYEGLAAARTHLTELGQRIAEQGLHASIRPLVFGLAGYGNVSRGCQEILDCLPITDVDVAGLPAAAERRDESGPSLLRVVFKEEHMVRPAVAGVTFALQDYYSHPENYRGCFAEHLPYLDVLVNTIYWEDRYPRLVTRDWAKMNYGRGRQARLQVIGDISCDIEGSVELTSQTTEPDAPCYVYDPEHGEIVAGCEGHGPVIMAVDNLPCELPRESSAHFSVALRDMVLPLALADWRADFAQLNLPNQLKKAIIVHKGELAPSYRYLKTFLK